MVIENESMEEEGTRWITQDRCFTSFVHTERQRLALISGQSRLPALSGHIR